MFKIIEDSSKHSRYFHEFLENELKVQKFWKDAKNSPKIPEKF